MIDIRVFGGSAIHRAPGVASHVFQNHVEGDPTGVRNEHVCDCQTKVNRPNLLHSIIGHSNALCFKSCFGFRGSIWICRISIDRKFGQAAFHAVVDFERIQVRILRVNCQHKVLTSSQINIAFRWSDFFHLRRNIIPNQFVRKRVFGRCAIHRAPGVACFVFQNHVEGDPVGVGNKGVRDCRAKVDHPGLGSFRIGDRYASCGKLSSIAAVRVALRSIHREFWDRAFHRMVNFQLAQVVIRRFDDQLEGFPTRQIDIASGWVHAHQNRAYAVGDGDGDCFAILKRSIANADGDAISAWSG